MNKIYQRNKSNDFQCFFLLKDVMLAPAGKETYFYPKMYGLQLVVVYQTKTTAREMKQQII